MLFLFVLQFYAPCKDLGKFYQPSPAIRHQPTIEYFDYFKCTEFDGDIQFFWANLV